jgi:hypothetical protein
MREKFIAFFSAASHFIGQLTGLTLIMERRRKRFEQEHKPLSDEQFIRLINAESEIIPYILALRHSMADICKISYELIHPDDHPETLVSLCAEWDDVEIDFRMEDFLGQPIYDLPRAMGWRIFFWKKSGPATFREWALSVGRYIDGLEQNKVQREKCT